jgi:hypothetical protein
MLNINNKLPSPNKSSALMRGGKKKAKKGTNKHGGKGYA